MRRAGLSRETFQKYYFGKFSFSSSTMHIWHTSNVGNLGNVLASWVSNLTVTLKVDIRDLQVVLQEGCLAVVLCDNGG